MPDTSVTKLSAADFTALKARVHTFESFGRAIVEAALNQAEQVAASGIQSAITATVQVEPIPPHGATHGAGNTAAMTMASKTGDASTVAIAICIGEHCHIITF
jgi:hypothetical protein